MAVAAGHGKSSMLPLIILITSLGAASPHTYWPLPRLWNHALLTQCWWCQWAKGCMMGETRKKEICFSKSFKNFFTSLHTWRCQRYKRGNQNFTCVASRHGRTVTKPLSTAGLKVPHLSHIRPPDWKAHKIITKEVVTSSVVTFCLLWLLLFVCLLYVSLSFWAFFNYSWLFLFHFCCACPSGHPVPLYVTFKWVSCRRSHSEGRSLAPPNYTTNTTLTNDTEIKIYLV